LDPNIVRLFSLLHPKYWKDNENDPLCPPAMIKELSIPPGKDLIIRIKNTKYFSVYFSELIDGNYIEKKSYTSLEIFLDFWSKIETIISIDFTKKIVDALVKSSDYQNKWYLFFMAVFHLPVDAIKECLAIHPNSPEDLGVLMIDRHEIGFLIN